MESSSSSKIASEANTRTILKTPQAPRSQKDHKKQAKRCSQAPHPQKNHERQAKECAQALQLLKGYGKQSTESPQVDFLKRKPEWIERFLGKTFFGPCPEHPIRRNELNKYCIDCEAPVCQYCQSLSSHAGHRLLKIYRHVYKNVVLLDEIKRQIDCSKIQPYRCNKQMVLALTPLPHTGSKVNEEGTCHTCKRKLMESRTYSYCSISCKVEAFTKKKNDSVPPFLSLGQPGLEALTTKNNDSVLPFSSLEQPEQQATETKTSFRTRKRKGTPHRAPFF